MYPRPTRASLPAGARYVSRMLDGSCELEDGVLSRRDESLGCRRWG